MNNWTLISYKMPDKDGRYLVSCEYSGGHKWVGVSSVRNGKFDDSTATHWQNLPPAACESDKPGCREYYNQLEELYGK